MEGSVNVSRAAPKSTAAKPAKVVAVATRHVGSTVPANLRVRQRVEMTGRRCLKMKKLMRLSH